MAESIEIEIRCIECGKDLGGDIDFNRSNLTYEVGFCHTCLEVEKEEVKDEIRDNEVTPLKELIEDLKKQIKDQQELIELHRVRKRSFSE